MKRIRLGGAALAAAMVMMPMATANAGQCHRRLEFAAQPTTTQVATTMTPAVVVDVEKSDGEVDTGYNGPVTIAYAVNPDNAPLPASRTVDAVHGVATFPHLSFAAVGFGFELTAAASGGVSQPSKPFDVVGQLIHCRPGASCRTSAVQSQGTTGSAVAAATSSEGVLEATGGGFPALSCTRRGGTLTFFSDRPQTISVHISNAGEHPRGPVTVCWGDPEPFVTADGAPAAYDPANGDYEGALPRCRNGRWARPQACVLHRDRAHRHDNALVFAPGGGDPHITF